MNTKERDQYKMRLEISMFKRLKEDNKMLLEMLGNNFSNIYLKIDLEENEEAKKRFYDLLDIYIKFSSQIDNLSKGDQQHD
jgi:hypothetical protein